MDDIVFIGDWIKDRVLGSGSFGVVVLWKHKETGEKLAVKTCKWSDELTEKHKERWSTEVEMLRCCNNPNIVGTKELPPEFLHGLERANPSRLPILCMEYCSGGDLRQILNKFDSASGLREYHVRQILSDVGNAMKFLHSNKITHRDLKPENIVMQVLNEETPTDLQAQQQQNFVYKLIDLGYAKELDSKSVCASFVGTLQYLAPEILYSKTYSNSVDFWSFGLLVFEVACGVRPFLPFMAPVQWMPHVKKKLQENICVYETYHGDIEYSNEIFPENFISAPFKGLIEKWLRVVLEWDPKSRGRVSSKGVTFNVPSDVKGKDSSSNSVIVFNLLEDILSRKIIKIFDVASLSEIAFEVTESTTIATLKDLIYKNTKQPIQDQILISQMTYSYIANDDDLVVKYWHNQCSTMIYLYNKSNLLQDNIEPVVPKAIQRSLEHPKTLYNFKNSRDLYRSGFFFVISQKEKYDSLVAALLVRAESLKQEGKQLLLHHNNVDKCIGKLLTKQETIINMIDMGKKHIQQLKDNGTGTNFLGGFDKIFKDSDDLTHKINKLQNAWSQLTVRLQSAARRSNEVLSSDLNTFCSKYNYQALISDVMKAYMNYKRTEREFRLGEKQCHDIIKICYNCLKLRSKILLDIRHQPFVLKIMNISMEYSKIADVINSSLENSDKLTSELVSLSEDLTKCLWSTISILSSDANELADLPYSVVSFQKRDFKIGESVSNHCIKLDKPVDSDCGSEDLRSLIEESMKIRHNHVLINNKLSQQKKILSDLSYDFSFLKDKN